MEIVMTQEAAATQADSHTIVKNNKPYLEGVKRIYLSGPMKGYPEFNYPLFNRIAKGLRDEGFIVYNPAEFKHDEDVFPIRKAFAEYSRFICLEADALVLLPGWEKSLGASAELALAKNCDIEIVEFDKI